jgi:hypothetical protein
LIPIFGLKTGQILPQVNGTWVAISHAKDTCGMLKITVVEDQRQRRVIVEGKLIAPWAAELSTTYQTARTDLQDRELIVDLKSLTAISPEGEEVLLQLMREKAKLLSGVYVKEVLKQLARNTCNSPRGAAGECTDSDI